MRGERHTVVLGVLDSNELHYVAKSEHIGVDRLSGRAEQLEVLVHLCNKSSSKHKQLGLESVAEYSDMASRSEAVEEVGF